MSDYIGDFIVGSTIRIHFNTLNSSFIPATTSVTPTFVVYKNSVIESNAGISPTSLDYDGKTGLHLLVIDTSADPFYEEGQDYSIVFTAGTVDGLDLTNVKFRSFSIENRTVTPVKVLVMAIKKLCALIPGLT